VFHKFFLKMVFKIGNDQLKRFKHDALQDVIRRIFNGQCEIEVFKLYFITPVEPFIVSVSFHIINVHSSPNDRVICTLQIKKGLFLTLFGTATSTKLSFHRAPSNVKHGSLQCDFFRHSVSVLLQPIHDIIRRFGDGFHLCICHQIRLGSK